MLDQKAEFMNRYKVQRFIDEKDLDIDTVSEVIGHYDILIGQMNLQENATSDNRHILQKARSFPFFQEVNTFLKTLPSAYNNSMFFALALVLREDIFWVNCGCGDYGKFMKVGTDVDIR